MSWLLDLIVPDKALTGWRARNLCVCCGVSSYPPRLKERPTADDYHLAPPLPDFFGHHATRDEIAAALTEAGITPEEFNAPEPPPLDSWTLKPESRFIFELKDGTLIAYRNQRGPWPNKTDTTEQTP